MHIAHAHTAVFDQTIWQIYIPERGDTYKMLADLFLSKIVLTNQNLYPICGHFHIEAP